MKAGHPYILWLPSWYPNRYEPYNGDFIQRHAIAASIFNEITLIHFVPAGHKIAVTQDEDVNIKNNLTEHIVYIPFQPSGVHLLDRIRYNFKFYSFARNYLLKHFQKTGLPNLVHVHVPVKAGNLALWLKQKFKLPYIVSEHGSYYLQQAPDNYYKRNRFYRWQVKKIFKHADMVTNVSRAIGNILINHFGLKRVEVIYNVVDVDVFNPGKKDGGLFTYIHVSSMTEQKNIYGMINVFIELYKTRKDWQLVLAGPLTEEIRRTISESTISENVQLTGEVAYNEVATLMKQSDAFVLFSRHENFPCVVIEALCCGLPVISTDIAGIREAVNTSNGILIPEGDKMMLLQSLLAIREHYNIYNLPEIAQAAIARYNYKIIGKEFDNLYGELLSK